ncbi:LOW QUALITY PROTEIN: transmembrane protein PVRIG [Talpa occidentalis]|uniref:LOW QUALITY PROTEIN: transmembrane protein PVRIG n=1 Tax=Talpa occidentalis TaxID=50954 RepID=UPI00188EB380|nr:LOW QUALITY PROTEIN: transmembrane protein PVRIG [Talpa occidentalis]
MTAETQVLFPARLPPEPGLEGAMHRARAPVLLVLLTLCVTAGTPEVWVQVQAEDANFTIRCGFRGSGSISLATVSAGASEDAGGTLLAVLHPELGTELWVPTCQAHWEDRTSILLTLEGLEGRSPGPNTTFCCKFTSYPEGSQEACGNLLLSLEEGMRVPTAASILRADLAGIMGASGVLIFSCICLLYLLHRRRRWSIVKLQPAHSGAQTQRQARMVSRDPLASLHTPYATVSNNYVDPPTMDTVPLPQPPSWGTRTPTQTARQLRSPAPRAALPPSARHNFISMEHGLRGKASPAAVSNTIFQQAATYSSGWPIIITVQEALGNRLVAQCSTGQLRRSQPSLVPVAHEAKTLGRQEPGLPACSLPSSKCQNQQHLKRELGAL